MVSAEVFEPTMTCRVIPVTCIGTLNGNWEPHNKLKQNNLSDFDKLFRLLLATFVMISVCTNQQTQLRKTNLISVVFPSLLGAVFSSL